MAAREAYQEGRARCPANFRMSIIWIRRGPFWGEDESCAPHILPHEVRCRLRTFLQIVGAPLSLLFVFYEILNWPEDSNLYAMFALLSHARERSRLFLLSLSRQRRSGKGSEANERKTNYHLDCNGNAKKTTDHSHVLSYSYSSVGSPNEENGMGV